MKHFAFGLLALAIGGCATTADQAGTAQRSAEEREYRTGSNIPVRDRAAATAGVKSLDPSVLGPGVPPKSQ